MLDFVTNNWKWLMVLKVIEGLFCCRYIFCIIGERPLEEERLNEKVKNDEYN